MIILPAIDLKDGKCVRLRQGRADDSKVYSDNPSEMARHWVDEGACYLHVVDLDGAFQGKPVHLSAIADILKSVDIPVEVGGGLRTDEDIKAVLDCGVDRAILGTRAVESPDSLSALLDEFGEKLAVGIDARNGMVQGRGWVNASEMSAVALAEKMDALGVHTIIYTDIATDGMLMGPNIEDTAEICRKVKCRVIASGGITRPGDIQALKNLEASNLVGAIVGKALYEGTVSLSELQD